MKMLKIALRNTCDTLANFRMAKLNDELNRKWRWCTYFIMEYEYISTRQFFNKRLKDFRRKLCSFSQYAKRKALCSSQIRNLKLN